MKKVNGKLNSHCIEVYPYFPKFESNIATNDTDKNISPDGSDYYSELEYIEVLNLAIILLLFDTHLHWLPHALDTWKEP